MQGLLYRGDQRSRCAGRCGQAVPGAHIKVRQAQLGQRGHRRQRLAALLGGHGQGLDGAALNLAQHRGQVFEHHVNFTGYQGRDSRRRPAVRNVRDEGAGAAFEQLRAQVQRSAVAVGRIVHAARLAFGPGNEIRYRIDTAFGVDQQHVGHPADQADGRDLLGLVGHAGIQGRADGQGRRSHEQGVAVGRRARHFSCTQVTAGTGFVVNHHRLAQLLRQLGRHQTGHDVDQTTRRERHHQTDRLGRPGLRQGQAWCSQGQAGH